jgi:hypothetical protein
MQVDPVHVPIKSRPRHSLKGRQPTDAALAEVRRLIGTPPADVGHRRDLLIEHLHALNDAHHGLPEALLVALAAEMNIPVARGVRGGQLLSPLRGAARWRSRPRPHRARVRRPELPAGRSQPAAGRPAATPARLAGQNGCERVGRPPAWAAATRPPPCKWANGRWAMPPPTAWQPCPHKRLKFLNKNGPCRILRNGL